ncbi:MAG: Helicase associated domain protein [Lachnospiraceae bacterium]|nr:Helicase associated domain protein [Lachnospiraceae bacterium]MBP3595264.1 Helicase associated domain protein [Lachnospiraceae bacterium]
MGIQLYKHNQEAYTKVKATLAEKRKACVVHPTGTGKSYIAFKLIEDHPVEKFLWLGPSEYIYRLQVEKLKRKQGIAFDNVEFHTYAWLMRNKDALDKLHPDYIILDEFHRCGAKYWGNSISKLLELYPDACLFGMTATNIRYLDKRRNMAEELFDGNICSEFDLVEAMVRGYLPVPTYVVCAYYYQEKLKEYEERISKQQNAVLKQENVRVLEKLRSSVEQAQDMSRVFAKHIKKKNGRFIVFCTNLDKMYEMMTRVPEWFAEIDRLPHVYCVHCYNVDADADFKAFQEDDSDHIKLLFTIDMLNEGIHVDDVDGVILLRPTISPIIYKQQIGRALASDAKGSPLIFDMVNNFDSLYNIRDLQHEFTALRKKLAVQGEYVVYDDFNVIDELRDSRELFSVLVKNLESSWERYYQELVHYKAVNGHVKLPRRYVTEDGLALGKWLNRQRSTCRAGKLPEEKASLLAELGVDFRTDKEVNFEGWYNDLVRYKIEHGHLLVPGSYVTPEGKKLGLYVCNTRTAYHQKKLTKHQIERLEAIGFSWSALDSLWERNYKLAEAFYKTHGHLKIGRKYKTEDGINLGAWIATQRNVYLGKIRGILTKEQKEKLDKLHMIWEPVSEEELFETKLKALVQYRIDNGDTLVRKTYVTKDGVALGQWVLTLRSKYSHNKLQRLLPEGAECPKCFITIEQEQKLNDAGMIWKVNDTLWEEMYEEAKHYYEVHGHLLPVPAALKGPRGRGLFEWLTSQQDAYRRNGRNRRLLTKDQIEKLQAIGLEWELKSDTYFEKGMEELKKYKKEHHSLLIPVSYITEDGYLLGKWAARQRSLKRKNKLAPDREQHLNKCGFIWDYTEHYWNRMYEEMKNYYQCHGSLEMPVDYTTRTGEKLWQWKMDMRKRYKNNNPKERKITEEQIKKLETIGMVWYEKRDKQTIGEKNQNITK